MALEDWRVQKHSRPVNLVSKLSDFSGKSFRIKKEAKMPLFFMFCKHLDTNSSLVIVCNILKYSYLSFFIEEKRN